MVKYADYGQSFAGNWLTEYKIYWKPHSGRAIAAAYFAFTSLSTVGFGDYHPQNEFECVLCAFILLFGVAIFSYVIGYFIEILESIRSFSNLGEDFGEELVLFLGTLRKFNFNYPIELHLRLQIEKYFAYRYKNDKNRDTRGDGKSLEIFTQLTENVQEDLYCTFLFKDFLRAFRRTFVFPNWDNKNLNSFYTWKDAAYRNFMMELMYALEPREEEAHVLLFNELEEVNEVLFFVKGTH